MPISKAELAKTSDLLGKGKTFSQIAKQYPQYDYWEIYWKVNDASFLGRKRAISNRLKKLLSATTRADRASLRRKHKNTWMLCTKR